MTANEPVVLDDIDRRIIEQLQKDGRKPYTQIAPAVGLSEAAVRQRVQRLIDGGVMQIVAVTDPRLLGFTRQAMIGLKIEGDTRRVADAVAELHEVEYVVLTAGALDMLIEVVVEDDEEPARAAEREDPQRSMACRRPRPTSTSASTKRRTNGERRTGPPRGASKTKP